MKYKIKDINFVSGIIGDKVKIVPIIFNQDETKIKDLLTNKVYNRNEEWVKFYITQYANIKEIAEEYHFEKFYDFDIKDFNWCVYPDSFLGRSRYPEDEMIEHNMLLKAIKISEKYASKKKEYYSKITEDNKAYEEEVKTF